MASHDRLHPICRQALGLLAPYGIAISVLAQSLKLSHVTAICWHDEAWNSLPKYQIASFGSTKTTLDTNLKKRTRQKAIRCATA